MSRFDFEEAGLEFNRALSSGDVDGALRMGRALWFGAADFRAEIGGFMAQTMLTCRMLEQQQAERRAHEEDIGLRPMPPSRYSRRRWMARLVETGAI
ncbi:hypothetical protein HN937_12310 [Candidatus Poribacteria bacterium]|nr:hypothetical protein [Candidatus Poribacteria bacterium]